MELSRMLQLALLLFATVAVPGVADYVLSSNGYPTLGMIVWAGGYGVGIALIWQFWIRPLDLRGPA